MKILLVMLSLFLISLAPFQPAWARGCIKGAIVGGLVGHYAGHHGLLGAMAGCAIGRHEAHKHQIEQSERRNVHQGGNTL